MYQAECPVCCSEDIQVDYVDAFEAWGERGPLSEEIVRYDIRCLECDHSSVLHIDDVEDLIRRAFSEDML